MSKIKSKFPFLGYLDERSTVGFLNMSTGEPFVYPDEKIVIELVRSTIHFHVHTCARVITVASENFVNPEALELFQVTLNSWLDESNPRYNSG